MSKLEPDDRPACTSDPLLFESRYDADHREAKKLCAKCPVFEACERLLEQTRIDYPGAQEGTWAGRHFTPRRKRGRPTKRDAA